ncbi:uncharacterized protein EV420DRAFT_452253 [Desarmillaria tabescens]|uniref:Uncharacterized protein n=1 Tax=Armillaria tabescens TaxID=1929756 RepID=A0AA39NMM9_ARMTA|nr:uncharacterized protein EV420DRAFT_452253 [Desarmillaria tabescens]KAK0468218.1 hypothetical protein EV420DRAFT_452253 [Desarmillaria tabescens]
MIEDAVAPKSQRSHLGGRVSQSSQGSASSLESCDAVEQQLTQEEKFDSDAPEEIDSVSQGTGLRTTPNSPTYANELHWSDYADHLSSSHSYFPQSRMSDTGPSSPDTISFQRPTQSWYQTRTPRKRSRGSKPSIAAPSPLSHNASPVSSSANFGAGATQPSQRSDGADGSQWDDFSAIPSQSIPPLQTQAPYRSQSPDE